MTNSQTIITLEGIAQRAAEQNAEILLDATTLEFSRAFQIVKCFYKAKHLHEVNQEHLLTERNYLDFLIEFVKKPYVKTTKRVISENRRIPGMISRRIEYLVKNRSKGEEEKQKQENYLLAQEISEKTSQYLDILAIKAYDVSQNAAAHFFEMAATTKTLTILRQQPKGGSRRGIRARKKEKYPDMEGEDSLAAIALERSTMLCKPTHAVSNDMHLQFIINNFYVIAKILDEHYCGSITRQLEEYPIQIHRIPKKEEEGYELALDTAQVSTMQDLNELAAHVGGRQIRNSVYLIREQMDILFGRYPHKQMSALMKSLKRYD